MRRLLALIILAALLAGCATTPPPTNGVKTPTPDLATRPDVTAPKFAPPILLGTITLGSEPNVAVDGARVYVTTPLALWRSEDSGKTFKAIGADACPRGLPACGPLATKNPGLQGGGDGATGVTPNGTLVWAGLGGGVPVQVSRDHGDSWSKPVDVANKNSSDREWVAVGPDGTVYVQWRDFGKAAACSDPTGMNCPPPPPSGILVRASHDDGVTFADAVKVTEDGHQGPIAPDPSSAWLYLVHVNGSTKLQVARSNDNARTWEDIDAATLVDDTFQFPISAVDSAGTVYVVYANGNFDKTGDYQADRFPNIPSIMMIHSTDHGATWSKPVQLSLPGVPAVFPWIAAGAPGRIVAAFYEGAAPTPMASPNQWHVAVVESTTADQDAPKLARAFVTAEPNHVGQICVVGSACGPQDRSLLDFFEVRIKPDGFPVLAYVGDAEVKMATVKVYAASVTDGTNLLR
ncbi:MAG: hypothetical protein WDA16_02600 [Candidatus Thermoplasmatota archaeon]